ncbi:hypothetical protein Pcinc_002871 [Petrolisthes cinctipes]|uniref:Reverse transcriptase domain-containing protein n=1 Tax=Petrolisthes cinctipes TaxID=88211 RepID=A0AAE1GK03_PETCI|nr:hypothetical protein Pcinc_002871 [Petrolisthes cinctipes]
MAERVSGRNLAVVVSCVGAREGLGVQSTVRCVLRPNGAKGIGGLQKSTRSVRMRSKAGVQTRSQARQEEACEEEVSLAAILKFMKEELKVQLQEQSEQIQEALQEQQRVLQLGMQGQLDAFLREMKEEQQQFKEEVYGELQQQKRQERSGKLVKAGEKGQPPAGISQVAPSPRRCKRTAIDSVRVDRRIDGKKCSLVIDSASEQTFVRPDVLHHRYLPESSEQLCGVTGHCAELKGPLEVRIEVAGQEATLPVYVAEMEDQCLLGLDYLLSMGCELNFCSMKPKVRGMSVPVTAARHTRSGGEVRALRTTVISPRSELLLRCRVSSSFDSKLGVVEDKCWSDGGEDFDGNEQSSTARNGKGDGESSESGCDRKVQQSLNVRPSAVVLVRKKDGSVRCCVDYRALNEVTVKDAYPLPRIDDTLDALSGAKWFSTLDMKAGYHQVKVAEKDREKTAFSYGRGLWQFKVMPFGLCNASATFERLMDRVLEGLHWQTALIYLDDVTVFGQTFNQELERLSEVFNRIRAAHLKLNPKKCHLFQKEVQYLGHIVGENGIHTDPEKVSAVKD